MQEAFERHASSQGSTHGLDVRALREALKDVGIEATATEAVAMHRKYDARRTGRLALDEFSRLVREFHAFDTATDGGNSRGRDPPGTPSTPARAAPAAAASASRPTYSSSRVAGSGASRYSSSYSGARDERREEEERRREDEERRLSDEQKRRREEAERRAAKDLKPPPLSAVEPLPPPFPPPLPTVVEPLPSTVWRANKEGGGRGDGGRQRKRWGATGAAAGGGGGAGGIVKRQEWGGGEGGVYSPPEALTAAHDPSVDGDSNEAGVLRLLSEYAGGKTLHPSQMWVVRAMRGLELRYQAAAREEGVQRFKLEVHAQQLAHDLSVHQTSVREAHDAKRQAQLDAERAHEALREERELSAALRVHNESLVREQEAGHAELERLRGALRASEREVEVMRGRWQQSATEAGEWAQRAYEAQTASRQALAEANESRGAAAAMERSMLTAQEYRLAEEAGCATAAAAAAATTPRPTRLLDATPLVVLCEKLL